MFTSARVLEPAAGSAAAKPAAAKAKTAKAATAGKGRAKAKPKKAPAKKAPAKKKAAATKAKKPKRKVAAKKKPAVKKKIVKKPVKKPKKPVKMVIHKKDYPPKTPPNSFAIFYHERLRGDAGANSLPNIQAAVKEAASVWRTMTEAQKQPYRDLYQTNKAQYLLAKEKYYDTTDPKVIREISKRRVARGRKRLRITRSKENRKPPSSFMRFLTDLRDGPVAREMKQTEGNKWLLALSREAGKRWRAMSPSDKAPYISESKRELDTFKEKRSARS